MSGRGGPAGQCLSRTRDKRINAAWKRSGVSPDDLPIEHPPESVAAMLEDLAKSVPRKFWEPAGTGIGPDGVERLVGDWYPVPRDRRVRVFRFSFSLTGRRDFSHSIDILLLEDGRWALWESGHWPQGRELVRDPQHLGPVLAALSWRPWPRGPGVGHDLKRLRE